MAKSESEKNVAQGTPEDIRIEEGFLILKMQNDSEHLVRLSKGIDSNFLQFHFTLKGLAIFNFNEGRYAMQLSEEQSLLLYNPQRDLPLDLDMNPRTWIVSILISIKKFHSLFSMEADYIPFLSEENRDRKYYNTGVVSPAMAVVLSQIMNCNIHPGIRKLYLKGKVYELLGLYFNKPEDADLEQCPYLLDEDNIRKIKRAKDIVISRMAEPPGLQELSEEIGLNVKRLKEGFKQIYGDSVYSFLFDYKMETARKMLETGNFNVNEVGLKVGYSTSSHFIAAFRKKFGTTPKKYLQSLSS